jgi:hypothetical protein
VHHWEKISLRRQVNVPEGSANGWRSTISSSSKSGAEDLDRLLFEREIAVGWQSYFASCPS